MSVAWFLGAAAEQATSASASLPSSSAFASVGSAAVTPPLAWWRLAALIVLFAVLLGIWFYLNRSRFNLRSLGSLGSTVGGGRKIEVKEQRWLTSRTSVALVEVDGQRFLLAHGPDTASWQPLQPSSSATPLPPAS
ncbi:Flagellar biosynthesis protein, FliO [Verrucomicrobium sp. GAS474]|uniref:flagellar biosynthetic protein FliO n=1 Tax=Verrucomicrobium sp. GAS474 TaxID=1882831 RepID=UPI000879756E|nr:flagellar biosynthetic protein FliO [Verrucomicrobium sp. GAS474]SDU24905.1 Flagellar biosynthesis protein, FliO [Verrucomicrobium sp. GAS474]